ncbi:MAG: agmatine deiminase family protein [Thiohalomonadales bacterium]
MVRLLAEWENQQGVLLTWPHEFCSWRDSMSEIWHCYEEITWQITRFEAVHILCYNQALRNKIQTRLFHLGIPEQRLQFHIIVSNDTWIRDYGPLRIKKHDTDHLIKFRFNGWGGKYSSKFDDRVTNTLFKRSPFVSMPQQIVNFVLEGGSIDSNGQGCLLTTTSCLLNANRNPTYNKFLIEAQLKHDLGIQQVIWLEVDSLPNDDTDGHIDTLARFCNPTTIIYNDCRNQDTHCKPLGRQLQDALAALQCSSSSSAMQLITCPLPTAAKALPASYVNFLIINHAVLVPTYQDPLDIGVLSLFAQLFPDREVIGIDCMPLIKQYGSLHCATMQF